MKHSRHLGRFEKPKRVIFLENINIKKHTESDDDDDDFYDDNIVSGNINDFASTSKRRFNDNTLYLKRFNDIASTSKKCFSNDNDDDSNVKQVKVFNDGIILTQKRKCYDYIDTSKIKKRKTELEDYVCRSKYNKLKDTLVMSKSSYLKLINKHLQYKQKKYK